MKKRSGKLTAALLFTTIALSSGDIHAVLAQENKEEQLPEKIEAIEDQLNESGKVNPFTGTNTSLDWYIEESNRFKEELNIVREALGLSELHHDERLLFSARATANYWFEHYHGNNISLDINNAHTHSEKESDFYVGANPWDRMKYFGFENKGSMDTTEVIAPGSINSTHGFDVLMAAPYHRMSMLSPHLNSIGVGEKLKIGNTYRTTVAHLGRNRSLETPSVSEPIVYPYPGQTEVPIGWDGAEEPNPLQTVGKENTYVGYPITVQKRWGGVERLVTNKATLRDEDGKEVETYTIDSKKELSGTGRLNHLILIPVQPLKPSSTYTVTVDMLEEKPAFSGEGESFQKEWSFTTASSPQLKDIGIKGKQFQFNTNVGHVDEYAVDIYKEGHTGTYHSYRVRNGKKYHYTPKTPETGKYRAVFTTEYMDGKEELFFDVVENDAGERSVVFQAENNPPQPDDKTEEDTNNPEDPTEDKDTDNGTPEEENEPPVDEEVPAPEEPEEEGTPDAEEDVEEEGSPSDEQEEEVDEEEKQDEDETEAPSIDEEETVTDGGKPDFPKSFKGYKKFPTIQKVPNDWEFTINITGAIDPKTANEHSVLIYDKNKEAIDTEVRVYNNNRSIGIKSTEGFAPGTYTMVITKGITATSGRSIKQEGYLTFTVK
ncbi:CAP domain-containing protein [Bacillus piscicola]|uniref:CAP domain-containing protein n=1 Tax=Bacillus piscicola TaxID=1632684 RepID=UPI001F099601|nr:CAP domain-containing protein [Bacillus piscicola]